MGPLASGFERVKRAFRSCRMGFDGVGLLLFLAIMAPNLCWFAFPAPEDILREIPSGGWLEGLASLCQVLLAAALVWVVNPSARRRGPLALAALGCCLCYYAAWLAYYRGAAVPAVFAALGVFPCGALLLYEADRKNAVALAPTVIFTMCHLILAAARFGV